MPHPTAYLTFPGNCAEAMHFYERTFGGKITALMRHADTPHADQVPPESRDKVMHAALSLPGNGMLMAGDAPAHVPFDGMKGFMLAITYDTVEEATRIFNALAEGGTVQMPIGPTFWALAFGMLTDRYGTPWAVNGEEIKTA